MSSPTTRFGILVGVDGSGASDAAIHWATNEAVMRGEPVTLMHVVAPVVVTWPVVPVAAGITEWQEEHAQFTLQHGRAVVKDAADGASVPEVRTEIRHAAVARALIDASRDALMTVVGRRGLGVIGRTLLGSVSTSLLHHACGPIAVVHDDDQSERRLRTSVVLGLDGSPASEEATALAFEEASLRKTELVALHAWADTPCATFVGIDWARSEQAGHEMLAERLAEWQRKYPRVPVRHLLVVDQPARWLIDASPEAQLVVVGSLGRGGFAGMLVGSVGSTVAHEAKAPTIVVRRR
jgi:nucleotide-binding universal stress UspA family protein